MESELLPGLFKTEYSKLVAVLCKHFGLDQLEIAEDIAHDTFLLATETWGLKGIPEKPTAWLYAVAKNKTRDYLKRKILFDQKVASELSSPPIDEEEELNLSESNIQDSQLQMMFAVCHPLISTEAQIGLALRILCGFGINEIAIAFLSSKETINKRLYRAKETLRKANIQLELPSEETLENRLGTVLRTLYLLFNEGYHATDKNATLRKELCVDAMRLTKLLCENKSTALPQTYALMALMCFHASRFEARISDEGELILYEDQDRNLWNDELINRGNYYLIKSAAGEPVKYHLEARIAYWHSTKKEQPDKWENILQLYNMLLQLEYSPVIALNRTFALSKVKGKDEALKEAEKLKLDNNPFYHALLGHLYTDEDSSKARNAYKKALEILKSEDSKVQIQKLIDKLN